MLPSGSAEARVANGALPEDGASRLGLRVLLASLAALFLSTLFCGWYFRDTGRIAAAGAAPALPWGLWPTTALLPLLSWCVERARRPQVSQGRLLRASFVLGLLFLAGQTWNWISLLQMETGSGVHPMYAFNFYLMTVLHALHVVGGLVYTLVTLAAVRRQPPNLPTRLHNHASYWHFLLAVWLFVLLNLYGMRMSVPEDSLLAPGSVVVAALLALACCAYQARAIGILWRRGDKVFAVLAILPPLAYLYTWARSEELHTERMSLHWGVLQLVLLIAIMFAGTLNLGQFAGNYEMIPR